MNLEISGLRLPLAPFELQFDAVLAARVTGVFGASGAGKTSLLECIAGLRRPVAGRISLEGVVLTDAAARVFVAPEKRGIGYVPQDGALFTHLSVRENLTYSQRARDVARASRPVNPKTARATIPTSGSTSQNHGTGDPCHAGLSYEHVVEVLNIGPLAARSIGSLSGGEKQRVAFGRALLAAPQLLLLDEPLASLDPDLKDQILPYLGKIRDEFNLPILWVSHNADELVTLCDEVLVLDAGRCVRRGPPAGLFTASPRPHHVLAKGAERSPVIPGPA